MWQVSGRTPLGERLLSFNFSLRVIKFLYGDFPV
jgi:hypothetical protein